MEYIYLLGGLFLLLIAGNYLVESAVGIAKKLHLSSLIIGMTVVAFGTSAPELVVSLQAAINGHPEIALGNVLGSNISNIGLIMGLTVIIFPIIASPNSIKVDWSFMMIISALLVLVTWDGNISRLDGLVGFLLLIAFVIYSIRAQKKEETIAPEEKNSVADKNETNTEKHILLHGTIFIAACIGLAFGADFLVKGASIIAGKLGISERVISVVIVGVGTSLPELTASVMAAIKKEDGITLGNIIGSNIFNVLCVLGLTSTINPIQVPSTEFRSDLIWLLVFSFMLFIGMLNISENAKKFSASKNPRDLISSQQGLIGRIWGCCVLGMYFFYVIKLFV